MTAHQGRKSCCEGFQADEIGNGIFELQEFISLSFWVGEQRTRKAGSVSKCLKITILTVTDNYRRDTFVYEFRNCRSEFSHLLPTYQSAKVAHKNK